jgi:hypothetical protein
VVFLSIPETGGVFRDSLTQEVAGFELLLRQKMTDFEPYLHPQLPQFAGIV